MTAPHSVEHDFFVSYTQSDRHWAEWIAWQLEDAGYRVAIQAWDFNAGNNFVLEMDGAIKRSKRTVAVLSSDYLRSAFAASEWAAAFATDVTGSDRPLLPVRVADVAPAGLLGQLSRVDVFDCDEPTARTRLLQAASAQRLKPSRAPGFPGDQTPPTFPATLAPVWNLPARNPRFAGRESQLQMLRSALATGGQTVVTQAISGLGGIGKSQLALEYAYRHASEYQVVWWIRAETPATRQTDLAALAHRLFEEVDELEVSDRLNRLRAWLAQRDRWLLIFDNVEKPEDLDGLLPTIGSGQVVVTSRHQAWNDAHAVVDLGVWSPEEASEYLIRRTALNGFETAINLVAELGYLPLAVEQAAAYIEETKISLEKYLSLFQTSRASLLGKAALNAKITISSIWKVSLASVAARSKDAVTLLQLLAFLPPDGFPRAELSRRASGLPPAIASLLTDEIALNEAVRTLRSYSLIDATPSSISVHRLVQVVVQEELKDPAYRTLAAVARQIQFGGFETALDAAREDWRSRLPIRNVVRVSLLVAVIVGLYAIVQYWFFAPLVVSITVYQDLARGTTQENIVNRSPEHEYVAVVIHGSWRLDVRDVNVNSVYLTDGTGSGVAAAMYHVKEGYDENKDGRDDLKLDYRIKALESSANKLLPNSTFYISGRLKDDKGGRLVRGQRDVSVVR